MIVIGIILIVVGIVLFFVQRNQKQRAFSVRSARLVTAQELHQMAGEIAKEIGGGSWRDYVKVNGMIQCDRPLTSELKQMPCVHYSMTVTREYEEKVTKTDSDGNRTTETNRGSETVSSNKQSVPFMVKDATGTIEVNPEGANIETVKVLDEFQQGEQRGGMLSFGGFSLTIGGMSSGGVFGGSGRRTIGYRYQEHILPLERRVLVVGTASDSTGSVTLQKPLDGEKKYIISLKTEEELTKAADNTAQLAFYGMIGCFVLGFILVLVDIVS
jgi:hypothetical protein